MVQLVVTTPLESGASIDFQDSLDGTTWQTAQLYPIPTVGGQESSPSVSSLTGPQPDGTYNYTLPVGGIQKFRLLTAGTWTTSVVVATITAGQGQYSVFNYSDNQANFLTTAYQGGTWTVAATQSGTWNVGVTGTVAVTQVTSPPTPWAVAPDGTVWTLTGTSANVNVSNTVTVTGTVSATQGTSPWVDNVTQWASTALGAPTAWGTAPTGNVIGTNAELFVGNNAVSGTNPVPISATTAANTSGNPIFVSSAITGTVTVVGNLTNNNAAPAANNIGSLDYIATASPETYTQGDQVLATTSLGGAVRVVPVDEENASSIGYYSADRGVTQTTLANATITPIISIRSNSASFIFRVRQAMGDGGGTLVQWMLVKNAQTLTGATWAATAPSGSNAQVDNAATAITIGTGVVVWSAYSGTVDALMDKLILAMAAGAPGDTYTVAAQKVGTGTSKVLAQIGWSEQSAAL